MTNNQINLMTRAAALTSLFEPELKQKETIQHTNESVREKNRISFICNAVVILTGAYAKDTEIQELFVAQLKSENDSRWEQTAKLFEH